MLNEFGIKSYLLGMHMHELPLTVLCLLFVFFTQFLKFIFQPLNAEFYKTQPLKYFYFFQKFHVIMTPLKILQP